MPNRVEEIDNLVDRRAASEDLAMTIEYLRARLHAERSVSRAARERVNELARRVSELEEKLNIVTFQRKNAEKATLEVLAVLENHGIGGISEEYDTDSGMDESLGENESNAVKEDKGSVNSNLKEVSSGSEWENTLSTGRSLSWNSRRNSPSFYNRKSSGPCHSRWSNYANSKSSPKHLSGKSCRRIKRREVKLAAEDSRIEYTDPGAGGENTIDCLTHITSSMDSGNETWGRSNEIQGDMLAETPGFLEPRKNFSDVRKCGYDGKMERALEHQAQVIGRYEAEEKAQKEWEEKYQEHVNDTQDSCEPGDHSDVTEERDEAKAVAPPSAEFLHRHNHDQDLAEQHNQCSHCHKSAEAPTNSKKGASMAHVDSFKFCTTVVEHAADKKVNNAHFSSSSTPGFAFPANNVSQTQSSSEKHLASSISQVPQNSQYVSVSNHLVAPMHAGSSFHKAETSEVRDDQQERVHEGDQLLVGVLDALQHAKLFLGKRMNTLPLAEGRSVTETVVCSGSQTGEFKTSVGSAGLFRVPTEFEFDNPYKLSGSLDTSYPSSYNAYSSLPPTGSNHYLLCSMEGSSIPSSSAPFVDSTVTTTESGNSSGWQRYGSNLASSSNRTYLSSHTSYSRTMPQLSNNVEMVSAPSPGRLFGIPPLTHHSLLYDGKAGSSNNMYR